MVARIAAGFAVAALAPVGREVVALFFALLSGSTILNVIKEELPRERESRFAAFVAGAAGYAGLLLLAA